MTTEIKLIAVDLDGTLLNTKQQLTERTEKAVKAAIAQGVQVVLATGKTRHSAEALIKQLGITAPGIFMQGVVIIYPDGSIRHEQKLDNAVARRVITFAEDRGFDVIAYAGNRLLVKTEFAFADEMTNHYGEPKSEAVGPLVNQLNNLSFNKLLIMKKGEFKKINALRWQLGMQLDGAGHVTQAAIADMIEVIPPGASKGKALKTLLRELGIAPENVLALGDGENDIEMIELAGIGVAVGNANELVKKAADHVVASNDEDGVAEAIEKFVLKQPEPAPEPETVAVPATEAEAETKSEAAAAPAETKTEEKSE